MRNDASHGPRSTSSPNVRGLEPKEPRSAPETCVRACPVCGGSLYEVRHKLQCERCHTIVETCCEGGRG